MGLFIFLALRRRGFLDRKAFFPSGNLPGLLRRERCGLREGGGLDLAQVAGDVVAGEDFADLGLLLRAAVEGVGAAGVEAAARRRVDKSISAYVCCGRANRALGGVLDGLAEISRLGAQATLRASSSARLSCSQPQSFADDFADSQARVEPGRDPEKSPRAEGARSLTASAPTRRAHSDSFNRRSDVFLTGIRVASGSSGHCDCIIARTGHRGRDTTMLRRRNHGAPRQIAVGRSAGKNHQW